jgi:hypothetical protein
LKGGIASGRAEEPSSFSQKKSLCEFFCEKEKERTMLPQARWAGYPDKRLVWNLPRKSCHMSYAVISPDAPIRLRQGGNLPPFFTKIGFSSQFS